MLRASFVDASSSLEVRKIISHAIESSSNIVGEYQSEILRLSSFFFHTQEKFMSTLEELMAQSLSDLYKLEDSHIKSQFLWRTPYSNYGSVHANKISPALVIEAINLIDWQSQPLSWFDEAIRMALAVDATSLAQELAVLGHELYPGDNTLAKWATVLAPPKIMDRDLPPLPGVSDTMEWLEAHSKNYYRQWVALRAGELLGNASSRKELVNQLGDLAAQSDVMITRII